MRKNHNKEDLIDWYKDNKITADRIINDLRKQTYEAVMHIYAYTAIIENVVRDFPSYEKEKQEQEREAKVNIPRFHR